jgi:hypothetical protein
MFGLIELYGRKLQSVCMVQQGWQATKQSVELETSPCAEVRSMVCCALHYYYYVNTYNYLDIKVSTK